MWWLIFVLTALLLLVATNASPECWKRKGYWADFCTRNLGMVSFFAGVALLVMVVVASYGYTRRGR